MRAGIALENQLPGPGIEERARKILGLDELEREPHALPVRVEHLWRSENFARNVPHTGSLLLPLGRAPDMERIGRGITAMVARHEGLHSRLALKGARAVLVPEKRGQELALVRATAADIAAYRDNRPGSPLTAFFSAPFDLYGQAGFRARAFADEAGEVSLAVLVHHYFGDAWSSDILRREVAAIVAGEETPPPEAQYSDYALFQRRALNKNLGAHLAYWHARLGQAPASPLPFDGHADHAMLGRAYFLVENGVMQKLAALGKEERVSLGVICFAAFQLALAKWCGVDQMVSGVQAADRVRPQFRGTIGYLLSAVAVHSRLKRETDFRQFLRDFAREVYDGILHQELAFELYDEIFEPPQPFCSPRFTFIPRQEGFFLGDNDGALPAINGTTPAADTRKLSVYRDLHFLVLEYPDGLVCRVIYNKNLSFGKISELADIYGEALSTIAGGKAKLGAFS